MTDAADSPVRPLVRRSNLMVPVTEERHVKGSWRHGADAVTLDLEDGVLPSRKEEARGLVREAIHLASGGGAEVFVRVNKPYLEADLDACVISGLSGIALPKVEAPEDVETLSLLVDGLERARGMEPGSTRVILLLESARGVWNVRKIVKASPRVSQVALLQGGLSVDLGLYASDDLDPYEYARGRVVIEGVAAGVQPVGSAYPLGLLPRILPHDDLRELALKSRNVGFNGIICPHPSWVAPVNAAFTPTDDDVDHHTQVRQVFAEGVAAGTAAVPFKGRMIDVPVDERAKDVLELAAACRRRDEEKRRALEIAGSG